MTATNEARKTVKRVRRAHECLVGARLHWVLIVGGATGTPPNIPSI